MLTSVKYHIKMLCGDVVCTVWQRNSFCATLRSKSELTKIIMVNLTYREYTYYLIFINVVNAIVQLVKLI